MERNRIVNAARGDDAADLAVDQALERLEAYIVRERFRGWDPYDALNSPFFDLPLLRRSKWLRVAAEQTLKRSPVNLRPLLRVPKGYNPVTLAFVLEASAYRALSDPDRADVHRSRAELCLDELDRLQTPGFSGACWGYDFPWESRYARLPAWTPTVVATGLVTNALFVACRLLGYQRAFDRCESATRFVLEDLTRLPGEEGTFCWSYSPGDERRVLNATMKGARLCAQVYAVTGEDEVREMAERTVRYVVSHQRADGTWPYAVEDRRTWADNFHTAYVLDALSEYQACTGDESYSSQLEHGWQAYRSLFFHDDRVPKYYSHQLLPVDATACAQSLVTLCKFGDLGLARRVAEWTIDKLQCADGHFAYQQRRRGVVTIPYMRWSSAYMYLGLSRLAYDRAQGGQS